MNISSNDQIRFAKDIIALADNTSDPKTLDHLKGLVSLFVSWVGAENDAAVLLSEFIGELATIAHGGQDTGWKDDFRRSLDALLAEDHSRDQTVGTK
ncbi:hypothetical protein [Streptomyces sp. TRM70350]|uniref:hypothetical protein n=1 Tax=Streptomyces sp. TRM70350 TaxID=2856165 RepID=UPI001C4701E7|nr:hypothetical protein [Streptomyces sp. TRM70350]MBV7700678.1 hypothetical protein [Streptomyces sp. TRM70350]